MRRLRAIEPSVLFSAITVFVWSSLISTDSAYGQPAPTVAEVLRKVKAAYSNMSQYRWSATITEEQVFASGKKSVSIASILVVVQERDKVRWEVTGSGAADYNGMYAGEEVIVSDGKNVSWYRPKLKQYTTTPIGPLVTPMGTVSAFIDKLEGDFFGGYQFLRPDGSRLLREESLSIKGSPVACYVIEIITPLQTVFTWWVDKKRNVVLREVFELQGAGQPPSLTRRTEVDVAQIGGPIDGQLFMFSPPAGATQVEAFK